jgi:hypothetical protein
MTYTVVIRAGNEGGYVATVPALPGCVSQGLTRRQTLRNAKEAIEITGRRRGKEEGTEEYTAQRLDYGKNGEAVLYVLGETWESSPLSRGLQPARRSDRLRVAR